MKEFKLPNRTDPDQKIIDYIERPGADKADRLDRHEFIQTLEERVKDVTSTVYKPLLNGEHKDVAEEAIESYREMIDIIRKDFKKSNPSITFGEVIERLMDRSDPDNPENLLIPDMVIKSATIDLREKKGLSPDFETKIVYGDQALISKNLSEEYKQNSKYSDFVSRKKLEADEQIARTI